ncbi:MAG TPA: erythromycin esterase family protein [Gemmatimonadales bacterium]|nr:erythromycin esterase family protein [Gemmatimonadales bacterium]
MTFGMLLRECAEPIPDVARMTLEPLLERLEQARVILIGGASYGTSECNRLRARLTRELIRHSGVTTVALAGSVVDAWWFDQFARVRMAQTLWPPPLAGFPSWLWRNGETFGFLRWLREHNAEVRPEHQVDVCGLDVFDFFDCAGVTLECLEEEAPLAVRQVRARLASISPCLDDPALHGDMTWPSDVQAAESRVLTLVRGRLERRSRIVVRERSRLSECGPELSLSGAAEFLKRLYRGSASAWWARQEKMFATLASHLERKDVDAKLVIWAHNADVGDAGASSTGRSGGVSLGQLCRRNLGDEVRLVGFGVNSGSLTAAGSWGGPGRATLLRPACAESYESICKAALLPAFALSLRDGVTGELREALSGARLQRAVGPVYQPETEQVSHYRQVSLPDQFDEYIWFNEGHAIMPVPELSAR